MAKHTPGPWRVQNDEVNPWVYTDSNPSQGIACLSLGAKEVSANAHLIKAAPTMLSALKEALDWLYAAEGDEIESLRNTLRNAIAEAEEE